MDVPQQNGAVEQRLFAFLRLHRKGMQVWGRSLGLYPGQPPILFHLAEIEGCTQRELCDEIGIRPASMTDALRRMEAAKLVSRRADPSDQRMSRVYLTDKGRNCLLQVAHLSEKMETVYLKGFTDAEKEQLAGYLDRILQNMQEWKM